MLNNSSSRYDQPETELGTDLHHEARRRSAMLGALNLGIGTKTPRTTATRDRAHKVAMLLDCLQKNFYEQRISLIETD